MKIESEPFETEMTSIIAKEIKLNLKQRQAFDYILQGKNVFITGAAGTGKSAVIHLFRDLYKDQKVIGVTSTTGVSAIMIGGSTLHSYCGIGLGKDKVEDMIAKVMKNTKAKRRITEVEVLIIDEISMLDPVLFDKLEAVFRAVRCRKSYLGNVSACTSNISEPPFGGVQLILSGDFLQLPVVESEDFCFEAKTWKKCVDHTVYLDEIMRQADEDFQTVLNDLRFGKLTKRAKELLKSRIGIELTNELGIVPTKIYTTNADVNLINERELEKLNEEGVEFYEYEMEVYLFEFTQNREMMLEKYRKSCLAPDTLQLCRGAQVMLLYNMDVENGLANGSRGIVTDFIEGLPVVRFLNGQERIVEYYTWETVENKKPQVRITQIPLKLAWAITAHKSQSLTLDYVEVNLANLFEFGLGYVALSRVKSKEGLKIIDINFRGIQAHPKALEYYKDIMEI